MGALQLDRNLGLTLPRGEHGRDHCRIESSRGAHLDEHGPAADIASVMEISGEQRFDDGTLYALAASQPDQPMGVAGVGGPPDQFVPKDQPIRARGLRHLSVERLGALPGAELVRAVGSAVEAVLRHVGVELERPPSHLDRGFRTERCDGAVQPVLGHPAPRTDGVRDDFQ